MEVNTNTANETIADKLADAKVEGAVATVKSNGMRNTLIWGGLFATVAIGVAAFFYFKPSAAVAVAETV